MDAVVLSIPHISPYMTVAFENGQLPIGAVIDRIAEYCRGALEEGYDHKVLVVVPGDLPGAINALIPKSWERVVVADQDGATVLGAVLRATSDSVTLGEPQDEAAQVGTEGTKDILWVDGLSPFWSVGIAHHLYNLHRDTWCDYTFADGFPIGFAPEIVRRETLAPLRELALAGRIPWTRTLLFDAVMQDINAFDVETEAAQEDYALLRVSLTVDQRGDYLVCRNAARYLRHLGTEQTSAEQSMEPAQELGTAEPGTGTHEAHEPQAPVGTEQRGSVLFDEDPEPVLKFVLAQGASHRTAPRYAQVQISTAQSVVPMYTQLESIPLGTEQVEQVGTEQDKKYRATNQSADPREELSPELFGRFLTQLHDLSPEATVAIGYRGEPALHSNFAAIIAACENLPKGTFFLETSGVGWTPHLTQLLINTNIFHAIIVEVDANTEQTYTQLRGEHWNEVQNFVEILRGALPGKVYVQATRLQENEWELQDFFRKWKETPGVTPIIQKYNDIAGKLPDRRVSDLSPITRCPCFHLQRDIVVLANGTVPRCFQDIDGEAVRGSITSDSLDVIWNRGADEYLAHHRKEYPAMCKSCDEYYTFNA